MNYEDRDTYGIYKGNTGGGPGPDLMGADTLVGNDVYNPARPSAQVAKITGTLVAGVVT